MREDDVEAQIELVDRVVSSGYQGLVLAPDQALSLLPLYGVSWRMVSPWLS